MRREGPCRDRVRHQAWRHQALLALCRDSGQVRRPEDGRRGHELAIVRLAVRKRGLFRESLHGDVYHVSFWDGKRLYQAWKLGHRFAAWRALAMEVRRG